MDSANSPKMTEVVGGNIRKRRMALGLTQAKLAERLSIGSDSVCRIERGTVAPKFQRLTDIAAALDCSVLDLFRTENTPTSVKLEPIEDMLRPLPPDIQEEIVCVMASMIQVMKKRL